METLKHLSYLNVSINKLHGEIPTGGCFANFTLESFVENDGFCGASRLQVPSCRNATLRRSMSRTVLFFRCILPIIALVILVCVAIIIFKRRQARNFNAPTQTDLVPPSLRKVTYFELVRATDSFSESNLLGSGSFGSVYKAVLLDGINVAVKVFNMQLERTLKSFTVECEVLRKVRHRNLVGITSSCTNLDFMALVLEYMPCGSLEKWLYSHNYCLDISQRLNIMIDVARALEYLHHGQTTPIVHCDLKPSNVLLDEDMVAHVSDFGISKLLGEDEFVSHTNTLATVGYMAPGTYIFAKFVNNL
jgi:LRR receptor-like serine/threonine-protein kinase FLS2